ncbi:MAG: hypothetical protein JW884_00300, partial [Deltaproteobacteria bacterium]|nr:hypothetical protein [Deltaproteobacteria bacterium]
MEYYAKLNGCEETTMKAVEEFGKNRILKRILHHDHRVWKEDPAEISNRLGWLACPHAMESAIDDLERFAASVAGEGFTDVALIGMGGSSLAPEVLVRLLGSRPDRLRLRILDSTDPGAVVAAEES